MRSLRFTHAGASGLRVMCFMRHFYFGCVFLQDNFVLTRNKMQLEMYQQINLKSIILQIMILVLYDQLSYT